MIATTTGACVAAEELDEEFSASAMQTTFILSSLLNTPTCTAAQITLHSLTAFWLEPLLGRVEPRE